MEKYVGRVGTHGFSISLHVSLQSKFNPPDEQLFHKNQRIPLMFLKIKYLNFLYEKQKNNVEKLSKLLRQTSKRND